MRQSSLSGANGSRGWGSASGDVGESRTHLSSRGLSGIMQVDPGEVELAGDEEGTIRIVANGDAEGVLRLVAWNRRSTSEEAVGLPGLCPGHDAR